MTTWLKSASPSAGLFIHRQTNMRTVSIVNLHITAGYKSGLEEDGGGRQHKAELDGDKWSVAYMCVPLRMIIDIHVSQVESSPRK